MLDILIKIMFVSFSEFYETDVIFTLTMDNLAIISIGLTTLELITRAMIYGLCHLYSDLIFHCQVKIRDDSNGSNIDQETQ